MKIIHCSDLHLDSKMGTNLNASKAKERNNEIILTFSRMVDYALENSVDLILIAGDLFDTERISLVTVSIILDKIRSTKNIDFLYLKGNHDESSHAFIGEELPENLKLFGDQWKSYVYDFLTVSGIEINDDNCSSLYDELNLDQNDTNIVMLHGQVTNQCGIDMVCLPKLKNKNIDYLALGHIHSYKKDKLDSRADYCYCGCLEGRGFDECEEKGFVLLDVKKHHIISEFIPFSKRQLHEVFVDISDKSTFPEIKRELDLASNKFESKDLVEFILTGNYTLDTQKDIESLSQFFSNKFYFVKIKDETKLKIEKESYENDISLKGEFIRGVMNSTLSEEDKESIICSGIQALSGKEISL